MGDLSDVSSISVQSFPEVDCEMPDAPTFEHGTNMNSGINMNPTLGAVSSLHPGHESLLKALEFLRILQTPIEFAYYLHGLNDYLKEVIQRKEQKLKKMTLNETATSDATSVVNCKFQAIQDQYQSFYGNAANLNVIQANSTANHSFFPVQNCLMFPQNNETEATFASRLCTGQPNNRVQKFSEMEDTFGSALYSGGESYNRIPPSQANISVGKPGPSRFPRPLKPAPLQSSLFEKTRNNLSAFHANNSAISEIRNNVQNKADVSHRINDVKDQFSCVRVGPLSKKFHLSTVQENEHESDNESISSSSSSEEGGIIRISNNTEEKSTLQKKSAKNTSDPVLTNWTIILKNKCIHLKGTKMFENNIVEDHITEEIIYRTRDGKIKTKSCFYQLKDPFVLNEDMPQKVRHFVRNNKFPITWRNMLKTWVQEVNETKKNDGTKLKPCQVVLERNLSKVMWATSSGIKNNNSTAIRKNNMEVTNIIEKKKIVESTCKKNEKNKFNNNAREKNETEKLNKKSEASQNSQVKKREEAKSCKRPVNEPSSSAQNKKNNFPPKRKHQDNQNKEKDKGNNISRPAKKANVVPSDDAKNKKVQTQTSDKGKLDKLIAQNKNAIENNDDPETRSKKNTKEVIPKEVKNKKVASKKNLKKVLTEGVGTKKLDENGSKNVYKDLFGESLVSPSQERNTNTPSALLRSIKKNPQLLNGRHTPPLKMISEYLSQKTLKNGNNIDMSMEIESRDNPVAKRMAKMKGAKKVIKKPNVEKSPENEEVQNVMDALTNKTPQTTPKVIREVFRGENESDSDFGSDISSISS